MALEDLTGTNRFIDAFNVSWPTDSDFVDEGDDHVRGIKNVLKNTFPNFAAALESTPAEIDAKVAEAAGIPLAEKGVANGVATLDATAHIPNAQINGAVPSGFATLDTNARLVAVQNSAAGAGGQTWQDVKASRTVATNYTNSTGKAIQVNVTAGGADSGLTASINNAMQCANGYSTVAAWGNISFIVQPGDFYQVGTSASILLWAELR